MRRGEIIVQFGTAIKTRRIALGISQEELASVQRSDSAVELSLGAVEGAGTGKAAMNFLKELFSADGFMPHGHSVSSRPLQEKNVAGSSPWGLHNIRANSVDSSIFENFCRFLKETAFLDRMLLG